MRTFLSNLINKELQYFFYINIVGGALLVVLITQQIVLVEPQDGLHPQLVTS